MKQFKDKIELLGTPPAGCMATMRVTVMALLVAFVLSSCTKDLSGGKVENGEEFTDLTIELLPPDDYSTAESRAQMEPTAQNLITDAMVMVYSSDNLIYFEKVGVTENKLVSTLRTSANTSELFKIVVIANPPTTDFNPVLGQKLSDLEAVAVSIENKWSGDKFVMSGSLTTLIMSDKNSFKINMVRSLARIDIGLGKYNATSETWGGITNFDLKEVYVVNTRGQFALFPVSANSSKNLPSVPMDAPVLEEIIDKDKYSGGDITTYKAKGVYINSTIFIAEAPSVAPNNVIIIVGGILSPGTATSYYRIDLCVLNSALNYDYLPVLRNHRYRITILDVLAAGYATAQEALNGSPFNKNIKVLLQPLDLPDDGGDIVFNDDSYIMTDVSEVHIYGKPDGKKSYSLFSVKAGFPLNTLPNSVTGGNVSATLANGVSMPISDVIPASGSSFSYVITVGKLKKTVNVIVKPPIDAHFDILPLANIADVKLVGGSYDWVSFSNERVYRPLAQSRIGTKANSEMKAYVHFHENIATEGAPRTMEMIANRASSTTTATSERTHFIVEQKNLSERVVQGFGDYIGNGYTANLAFECDEELFKSYEGESAVGNRPWGFFLSSDIALNADVLNRNTGKKATIFLARSEDHGILEAITRSNIYAARYCYEKNRDVNGNGTIDDSEVVWYLPSIEQLKKLSNLGNTTGGEYWSSTIYEKSEAGNNSTYSFNFANSGEELRYPSSKPLNVRCVRDIPIK